MLGNLAGNAIAMGQYIMQAAGQPDKPEAIRGIAVAALIGACLIHGLWRNGGIVLNNVLAIIKILTLMAVIIIGFAVAGGASFGNGPIGRNVVKENFNTRKTFSRPSDDAGSYARSIVLQQVGMVYLSKDQLCAVPKDRVLGDELDMANIFFRDVFGNETASRVMSGIIALSIFGNIIVMTFTASK
ncbi:MAG: hypothetical protein Q9177_005729, partial [Variospora cf. flavescens]